MNVDGKITVELKGISHSYDILVGADLLNESGKWAKRSLEENTKKIVLVSNEKVFGFYGQTVKESFEASGIDVSVWLMEDGEEFKNLESLRTLLDFLCKEKLKRNDAIVALGGGVVGDLAGFGAAIYLRGIQFLQIPTTFLSMIDSSVGGKTGVNNEFGKNLIGTFHQPQAVLVDIKTLNTLEERELAAGLYEGIKHAVLSSSSLLNKTSKTLNALSLSGLSENLDDPNFCHDFENLITENIKFKAMVVSNDEREAIDREDSASRKILNFGHTTAHALEKITDYKYFKHGEAVGYGMLVAGEISKKLELCDADSISLLNDVVSGVGNLPATNNIDIDELMKLFVFDKKSIGDSLQWILIEGIGRPKVVSNREIPPALIKESLQNILMK